MKCVAIVDYGMGNLRSVANAVGMVGGDTHIVSKPSELGSYSRIIVPGVGAFAAAMNQLQDSGMVDALEDVRKRGIPILGICLGMQLFCLSSEEDGFREGLGWIDARVRHFPAMQDFKVPHMGWDDIQRWNDHDLTRDIADGSDYYFVHSYYVDCVEPTDVLLGGEYGVPYCAVFARENIAGTQFHPEKSQHAGLHLLKNFVDWSPC